jgi:hypothetical protein
VAEPPQPWFQGLYIRCQLDTSEKDCVWQGSSAVVHAVVIESAPGQTDQDLLIRRDDLSPCASPGRGGSVFLRHHVEGGQLPPKDRNGFDRNGNQAASQSEHAGMGDNQQNSCLRRAHDLAL